LTAEIFSPPYLSRGARPTITSAPSSVSYNTSFSVATPNAAGIASVSLMRLGSVTHHFNTNQRYLSLPFQVGSGTLAVQAPANANIAPPGHYMLFILDSNGVPSVASILSLQ
jgi:galactose oxidase